MPKRSHNLDKLLRKLNHESLFNPDPDLREKFTELYALGLGVDLEYEDLLYEFHKRELGEEWFTSRDNNIGHSVDDVQYRDEDEDDANNIAE